MTVNLSFLLVVVGLTGIYSITTVHKVSVKAGQSVSIPCLYDSKYKTNLKYLCKGSYWNSCSYIVKTNQPSSGKFQIFDDKNQGLFTVSMTDLKEEDTSYYWCVVEIDGGIDDGEGVDLYVTRGTPSLFVNHQHLTVYKEDNIAISCFHQQSGDVKWCRLGGSCVTRSSELKDGTRVDIKRGRNVFNVTMSGLRMESSGWYLCIKGDFQMPVHITVTERPTTTSSLTTLSPTPDSVNLTSNLMSYIIPLICLIVPLMVMLFIWFLCKIHKRIKEESSAMTMRSKTEMKSDADLVYSSVVTVQKVQRVEAQAEDVTYSTLAQPQQNPCPH